MIYVAKFYLWEHTASPGVHFASFESEIDPSGFEAASRAVDALYDRSRHIFARRISRSEANVALTARYVATQATMSHQLSVFGTPEYREVVRQMNRFWLEVRPQLVRWILDA